MSVFTPFSPLIKTTIKSYTCAIWGIFESLYNLLNVRQDPRQYASIPFLVWSQLLLLLGSLLSKAIWPIMDTKKKHICIITNLLRKSVTARIFTFSGYYKSKGHYYTMQCQINPSSQVFFLHSDSSHWWFSSREWGFKIRIIDSRSYSSESNLPFSLRRT